MSVSLSRLHVRPGGKEGTPPFFFNRSWLRRQRKDELRESKKSLATSRSPKSFLDDYVEEFLKCVLELRIRIFSQLDLEKIRFAKNAS